MQLRTEPPREPSLGAIGWIVAKAFLFLLGALVIGSFLSPRVFRGALALRSRGVVQSLALGFCFFLSYFALRAGLAPHRRRFRGRARTRGCPLRGARAARRAATAREPRAADWLLVPVFFVRMGMLVDVRSFASPSVLGFAALLTAAAILGKLACALVTPKGISRPAVGLAMMPRGEVGLIFAGIGSQLMFQGRPVIETATYAAAVCMVVATTMSTPPLLLWSIRRAGRAGTPSTHSPGE